MKTEALNPERTETKVKTGYTPGPWKFVPWHIAESASEVRAPGGWLICCASSDANARLIAAAPSLLDALKQLLASEDFSNDREHWESELRQGNGHAPQVLAAMDAVAGAEG